jgi:hypothetical protein
MSVWDRAAVGSNPGPEGSRHFSKAGRQTHRVDVMSRSVYLERN